MKRLMVLLGVASVFCFSGVAAADQWYKVSFTGTDIWTYSADNSTEARTDQAAPRRYRDWTVSDAPVQATTYGLPLGSPLGFNAAFGTLGAQHGFAFDEINLWGAGDAAAAAWGEKYVSVGTGAPNPGVSSWQVLDGPTGWTNGIVEGGQSYSADATHAFPVWRSGTGATLSQANMTDPSFNFTFLVDISNPATAFEPDGNLRVFFGGFSDDLQGAGPDNHEVSGVMELRAVAVPEPSTLVTLLTGLGAMGPVMAWRKRKRAA